MPRASIIITTHNRPHLLPRAIRSARASGSEVEVVVVDDASSDETAEVCQSVSGINYVRVERNQGVAGARNIGLVASHGEYISFLDDDDRRLPNSVDQQIETLEKNPVAVMIYGQAIPEDASGAQHPAYPADCPQGDILWELLTRNFIPCGGVVFRRECLARVGLLDDGISGIDDWDLWIRIAEIFSVAAIETPVMIWRQPTRTSAQGSSCTIDLIEQGRRRFREHWLKLPRVASAPQRRRRAAWRNFSNNVSEHLAWETFSALGRFELRYAARTGFTALRLHPTGPLGVLRRWTSTSTLNTLLASSRSRDELANAKAHFKRIRSSRNLNEDTSL
jgi:glycosyltransferase involved in cell wall biosynthesis